MRCSLSSDLQMPLYMCTFEFMISDVSVDNDDELAVHVFLNAEND